MVITEVYARLLAAESQGEDTAAKELAHVTRLGIDLLIAVYARAESPFEAFREDARGL